MHCINCSTTIEQGGSFCLHCGTPVVVEANASAQKGESTSPAPPPPPQQASQPPLPPPPPPSLSSTAAAAGANFAAALKKGVADIGNAKSADDVIRTVKQNRSLMAVGAGLALLVLVVAFRMVSNAGSPPACGDAEVQTTLRQILNQRGVYNPSIGGIAEESYDSKAETRSCKAVVSQGSDVTRIEYTVEWADKKADQILVSIQAED